MVNHGDAQQECKEEDSEMKPMYIEFMCMYALEAKTMIQLFTLKNKVNG